MTSSEDRDKQWSITNSYWQDLVSQKDIGNESIKVIFGKELLVSTH